MTRELRLNYSRVLRMPLLRTGSASPLFLRFPSEHAIHQEPGVDLVGDFNSISLNYYVF